MKKKIGKRISALVSMVLVLTMLVGSGSVWAKEKNYRNEKDVTAFVLEQMNNIRDVVPESTWADNTIIANIYKTYDFDYNVNSYIYEFSTSGEKCGYIQIDSVDAPAISQYSFGGRHPIDIMMSNTKKAINKELSNYQEKIIYTGGYDYYIESKQTNELFSIATAQVANEKKSVLKEKYNKKVIDMASSQNKEQSFENSAITPFNTPTTKLVPNIHLLSVVEMNDFSGYINHCAPVAGLNIVKYWAQCRAKTQLFVNNNTTFQALYSIMGSTSTGTDDYQAYIGLYNYGVNRGLTPTSREYQNIYSSNPVLSWTRARQIIDSGVPFVINNNWHEVVCVGYQMIVYTPQTLIIYDGYSKYKTYKVFDTYMNPNTVRSYSYSRWN